MSHKLAQWLGRQQNMDGIGFRYLKHGEYTEELNTFYEVKNRMPIAITAVGCIVYAEVFEEEVLFSIFYFDSRVDVHLADSIEDLEKLIGETTSVNYHRHIEQHLYDSGGESVVKTLIKELGPLEPGEIYGFDAATLAKRLTIFSGYGVRELGSTVRVSAATYFGTAVTSFKKETDQPDTSYIYTHVFPLFSDRDNGLKTNPPNAIKQIYNYMATDYDGPLNNVRSIHNVGFTLASHSSRLTEFICYDEFSNKKIPDLFALLQNNHQLTTISLSFKQDFHEKMLPVISSFAAISNFPLLKILRIQYVRLSHFPEELALLKNLQVLALIKTGIPAVHDSLGQMTRLRQLELTHMPLDGKLQPICSLVNLCKLILSNCGLRALPAEFRHLTKLEYLDLSENPLVELPEWIGELKLLKTLKLNGCKLATLPACIGHMAHLEEVDVKKNPFTALPQSLLKLGTKIQAEPKAKALYNEKVRMKLEKDGMKPALFTDFNFKLMVVQELMYQQELLVPKFDAYEFAKNFSGRTIDIDEEGYDMIPEIKEYFEKLEVPMMLLDEIEELIGDGGDDIYAQISPLWGGEADFYEVKSAKDAKMLPNLKRITLLYSKKKSILEQFEKMGIEADFV